MRINFLRCFEMCKYSNLLISFFLLIYPDLINNLPALHITRKLQLSANGVVPIKTFYLILSLHAIPANSRLNCRFAGQNCIAHLTFFSRGNLASTDLLRPRVFWQVGWEGPKGLIISDWSFADVSCLQLTLRHLFILFGGETNKQYN